MKQHYIFKATGIDMQQHGKERTEYKHERLNDEGEARFSAICLWQALLSAGWSNVKVEIREVTNTKHVATIKEEQHDT